MSDVTLGRLERVVDLRGVWEREAVDFTPWLAQPGNLTVLGETLGIDLILEAQERPVGPFRADILCKDLGTGSWVLVENQLERTDHAHLGQLLTYAAGLEAVTIVWVAANFTEEHRAALDWLNKITDESFRFFGTEIELWKIGDSPVAPRFNIVAKPNDWTRSVSKAKQDINSSDELSERRIAQRDYWAGLHQALNAQRGPVLGNRTPQAQSWMNYSIGRAGFMLGATMVRPRREIRTELYIDGDHAKLFFKALQTQRATVDEELGYNLDWDELPGRRACRVSYRLRPVDPDDTSDWPRQHLWLAKHLNDFHRTFVQRVRDLDASHVIEGAGEIATLTSDLDVV